MTRDPAFENQHVLVLMIKDDVLEAPVEPVFGAVERRRMALGADRAARHQPAAPDTADPRILDAIALEGGVRRHRPVVMHRDRQSAEWGKGVSVRVEPGGRLNIKKKKVSNTIA